MRFASIKRWIFKTGVCIVILVGLTLSCFSQESQEELAKAAQNPIANMMSFPFQNNTNFGMGPYNRTQNVLNIQPVLPFFKGRLITRTIVPFISQPDVNAESGGNFGVGDITLTAMYSPKSKGVIWGVGPIINFPTAATGLGAGEWGIGPSLVMLAMPGKWVLGGLANNVWSVGNNSINNLLFQYFINYNLPKGAYVSSAPIITANWNAEKGDQWTVPFGLSYGKIVKVGGKLPLNLQAGGFYNVVKPAYGADWTLRMMVVILLPTSMLKKGK
jgi:hypothetical protein